MPPPASAFEAMKTAFALLTALLAFASSGVCAAKKPAKMTPVPAGKPEIFELEPRGLQRGTTNRVKLIGTNLVGLTELKLSDAKILATLLDAPEATTNVAWIEISTQSDLTRGAYELWVKNTNAESSKLKIHIDDLRQAFETDSGSKNERTLLTLPVSFWGIIDPPGENDDLVFEAAAGDSLVFDLAAKSMGSKANAMLTLFDERDTVLAASQGFDGGDPLMQVRIATRGKYRLRITDRTDSGSKDHYYRISIGTFPVVTGYFPLGISARTEADIQLLGFNVPPSSRAHLKAAGAESEMDVPVPADYRTRGKFKVVVSEIPEFTEIEPNDTPASATPIAPGSVIDGCIAAGANAKPDVDVFQFEAHKSQTLVIETDAARRGSPIDTRIEVVDASGKPVERLLLQAVRDSHVTFRGIDSASEDLRVENWQEMELNQFMYLQGEVCRIFRMPQGPDSGFQFYGAGGKRRNYFDSSAVAHALDEPAYIVEPHPLGSVLAPNGLPVFTVYYANDDDADRKRGSDSKLLFTAPRDGKYFVRVNDSRGLGGERFVYRLLLREAQPDFNVTLEGTNPSINAGAGKGFKVTANRIDGFDGDIRVDIEDLPAGFTALSPLVVQAGHLEAKGTINAALDAAAPTEAESKAIKIMATALINGRSVTKKVNDFGKISLAAKPKLFVALEPYDENATNFVERSISDKPLEITIAPGQSVPARLKIKRNGHDDLVTFSIDSLPHGVIVDNIGLNGVLVPKGQDSRQIFLTAAKWVPEVDRLCFAQAAQAEVPTSLPLLLHVRKAGLAAR